MNSIKVVNIKCGGCENTIKTGLEEAGLTNIEVNVENQTVSFEGDIEKAREILKKLGYPPVDSAEAKSLLKKGKSFMSCFIGKIKK